MHDASDTKHWHEPSGENRAGFGKFGVSHRAARSGRNPATGATIQIGASKAAKFSAASALKKHLNP